MIDIHSHLLDDLDLKPNDIVKKLKSTYKNGVTKVVFTPRIADLKKSCAHYDAMKKRFKEVKDLLNKSSLAIDIELGAEVIAYKGIEHDIEKCIDLFQNKYIIIDVERYHSSIDELAYNLSLKGYIPIFTKVEYTSYKHLHTHTSKWRNSGAKILVTASNLYGQTFEAVKVRSLLRRYQIDYISTGRIKKYRPFFILRLSRWFVTWMIGPNYAKQVFELNAKELYQNTSKVVTVE